MWKLKTGITLAVLAFITGSLYLLSGSVVFFGDPASYLANSVGVSIGVEENMYSRVAKQLEDRADELKDKEMSLRELESEVVSQIKEERKKDRIALLLLSIISAVLSTLLIINFYFDRRRWRNLKKLKKDTYARQH